MLGNGNPPFSDNDIVQFITNQEIQKNYYQLFDSLLLDMSIAKRDDENIIVINEDVVKRMRDSLQQIFPCESEYITKLNTIISKVNIEMFKRKI